jgi:hypothetical protein
MVQFESLQEGWVSFSRIPCVTGCIDVWYGDCAHNPNSETKPYWNLNGFATFIRLDGKGEWIGSGYRGVKSFAGDMAEQFTSQEIWNELSKYNERYE